jgi:DNA-binding response OmpR family regulator
MAHNILLVDDDSSITDMLAGYLIKEGYAVTTASNGEEGLIQFNSGRFDLLIVDIMMPKLDGIEMIKIIRESSPIPILIMSAKDNDIDKAIGLGFGADDYIAKPFSLIEITARIKAAIRRVTLYAKYPEQDIPNDQTSVSTQVLDLGYAIVDLDHYSIKKGNEEVQLTSKEADILKLFLKNPNRVFTKAQIYEFIWQDDYMGDENVINVHIRRLRSKIEENPSEPKHLKTLWGIGYKWDGQSC